MSDDLENISEKLVALDVDPARAADIASVGRRGLGTHPPRRRTIEAVVVGAILLSFLVWALWKVFG